jgi:hypothetical protein
VNPPVKFCYETRTTNAKQLDVEIDTHKVTLTNFFKAKVNKAKAQSVVGVVIV